MGQGYLADTNAIIDYLENKLPSKSSNILDNLQIQLSVISRIELLSWPKISAEQIGILNDFIAASIVFNLDENIVLKSIEIRKNYRLKLPDAIVAATALAKNLVLLTRNSKDFEKIIELENVDPYCL